MDVQSAEENNNDLSFLDEEYWNNKKAARFIIDNGYYSQDWLNPIPRGF